MRGIVLRSTGHDVLAIFQGFLYVSVGECVSGLTCFAPFGISIEDFEGTEGDAEAGAKHRVIECIHERLRFFRA